MALLLFPLVASAQDYRALNDTVDNFKGMANEVRKSNPVLSVTSGEGIADTIKSLKSGRRKAVGGPVKIELPKDQQEALERRLKAQERAAELARRGPQKRVTPVAPPRPLVGPGSDVLYLAIFASPLLNRPRSISDTALVTVEQGQSRESLLAAIGKPNAVRGIAGLEVGNRETLVYNLDSGRTVAIRLADGKVVDFVRN
jgi:hypothetical protein